MLYAGVSKYADFWLENNEVFNHEYNAFDLHYISVNFKINSMLRFCISWQVVSNNESHMILMFKIFVLSNEQYLAIINHIDPIFCYK